MATLKARPRAAGKENQPPEKGKQAVLVSTLFEQKYNLKRKAEKEPYDVLASKASRTAKQLGSSRSSRLAEQNPDYRHLLDVTRNYREGTTATRRNQLEPVFDELVAQVDRLTVDGTAGHSSKDSAGSSELAKLSKPLSEDKIEVHRKRSDGTVIPEERKLGSTMRSFDRIRKQKDDELRDLLAKLEDVNSSIVSTRQSIGEIEKTTVAKLTNELCLQVASMQEEIAKLKATALADVKKARKEEKDAKKEQDRKLAELAEVYGI